MPAWHVCSGYAHAKEPKVFGSFFKKNVPSSFVLMQPHHPESKIKIGTTLPTKDLDQAPSRMRVGAFAACVLCRPGIAVSYIFVVNQLQLSGVDSLLKCANK